jgi:hypothetical protein
MATIILDGSGEPIELGGGHFLVAPNVAGTARIDETTAGTRDLAGDSLESQLASAGLEQRKVIDLDEVTLAKGARGLDAVAASPVVALDVQLAGDHSCSSRMIGGRSPGDSPTVPRR